MNALASCLYRGEVVHRRVAPLAHELRYRVYNLFVDVDELGGLARRFRLFGYNRFNLFSIDDRDHGPGDGTPVAEHVWRIARATQTPRPVRRLFMFCYPRVLGYVFNPLTVYYGFDADGGLCLTIYEVNNTFGDRHSYAIPANGKSRQTCDKELYVSPFNKVEGFYRFTVEPPAEALHLGIALITPEGPCLTAWFAGNRLPLTDGNLWRSFFSLPALPLRVLGGIHLEALRLWRKGLRLKRRPAPPASPVSILNEPGHSE
jgi:uncharacterized protein